MDSNGKVTGSVKKGAIATLAESTLLTATRDRSVLVEAIAQSSNVVESDNTAIFGGAFRGSKITSSIDSSIEGSPNKLTHATQIINPTDLGIMDVFYDAIKGVGVFHEILEAYNGTVDSPVTVNMVGARNRTISYDSYISAHEKANQQDPRINYNLRSNNGPVSRSADGTIRINREIYKDVNGIRQTKPLGVVEIKPKIK
ncbi:hypothetical protein [Chryseobacterium sp. JK1]|uniref:hypothetical protein n=1 Tax=Chryseobacterium sp. JK1 TaxID=874294 RepID=UPI003D69626A